MPRKVVAAFFVLVALQAILAFAPRAFTLPIAPIRATRLMLAVSTLGILAYWSLGAARFNALMAVLREAWPVWLALGLTVLVPVLFFQLPIEPTDAILYSGVILELAGIGTVAYGLSGMRQMFGRPTFISVTLGWFGRLASVFSQQEIVAALGTATGGSTASGEARAVYGVPEGASLEQRLDILEKNLDILRNELDARVRELRQKNVSLEERLSGEIQDRQREDGNVFLKLEEVAVGGIRLEAVGLIWVCFGMIGSSIPDKIAAWWF